VYYLPKVVSLSPLSLSLCLSRSSQHQHYGLRIVGLLKKQLVHSRVKLPRSQSKLLMSLSLKVPDHLCHLLVIKPLNKTWLKGRGMRFHMSTGELAAILMNLNVPSD
jgi:hypothetical protein